MIGFESHSIFVLTTDGRNFKVTKPLSYFAKNGKEYVIPYGADTDGASTPSILWQFLPPFGKYWLAAVLHDCCYKGSLLIKDGDNLIKANLSKEDSDNLLKEAMISLGVDSKTVETIYEGVHIGGWKAFKEDRS